MVMVVVVLMATNIIITINIVIVVIFVTVIIINFDIISNNHVRNMFYNKQRKYLELNRKKVKLEFNDWNVAVDAVVDPKQYTVPMHPHVAGRLADDPEVVVGVATGNPLPVPLFLTVSDN